MGWFDWLRPARRDRGPVPAPHERTDPTMPSAPSRPTTPARPAAPEQSAAAETAATRFVATVPAELTAHSLATLPWLFNCGELTDTPITAIEQDALIALDGPWPCLPSRTTCCRGRPR